MILITFKPDYVFFIVKNPFFQKESVTKEILYLIYDEKEVNQEPIR
jgi:hypothetical protein